MWAPADIFTPTVNAVAVAMQRATTFAWNNWPYVLIATAALILVAYAVSQLRDRPRR